MERLVRKLKLLAMVQLLSNARTGMEVAGFRVRAAIIRRMPQAVCLVELLSCLCCLSVSLKGDDRQE